MAREYIAEGAHWNGGVFAYKLKYVLNKAHELIDFTDYSDLFSKYDTLNKISFDYAVVEKEDKIQVQRFAGEWKDLGTWNTLTEAMEESVVGKGVMNENCSGVRIVNEMDVAFYTALILFRTLLNRNMWANPLSDVLGKWWIYTPDGKLTTEIIENFLLFMPFTAILFWCFRDKLLGGGVTFFKTVWCAVKTVFLFSFAIEMLQLVLRLGTWQLSDLFYNILGGAVGGIIYFIAYKIKHIKE